MTGPKPGSFAAVLGKGRGTDGFSQEQPHPPSRRDRARLFFEWMNHAPHQFDRVAYLRAERKKAAELGLTVLHGTASGNPNSNDEPLTFIYTENTESCIAIIDMTVTDCGHLYLEDN